MADNSQVAAVVESYLDGQTSKEDAAQQIGSLLGGAVAESSGDEQRLAELMEAVQPETTYPCTIGISVAICTSPRICG